jgi:hypothetical protein
VLHEDKYVKAGIATLKVSTIILLLMKLLWLIISLTVQLH